MKKVKQKIMLDVGCGNNCQHGFVGMDKRPLEKVQIVHDIESFPWPLEDDSCSVVMMSHVVEHIKPWLQFDMMNEVWRVLEDDGKVVIATPYGGSFRYIQDPTHCSPWNEATPYYFVPGNPLYDVYTPSPWKIETLFWNIRGDIELCMSKVSKEDK